MSLMHIYDRAYAACIPVSTTMEITMRCNIRCVHCYNFDRNAPMHRAMHRRDMPVEKMKSVITELAEAGCLYLSFSGGEALLHPHFYECVAHAREENMLVTLLTNGMLISGEHAARLAKHHVYMVSVSLYGACAATHDAITLAPGSFASTLLGIRTCLQHHIHVKLKYILFESNAREMEDMIQLSEELGVPFSVDFHITSRYDGETSPQKLRVGSATMEWLYRGPLKPYLQQKTPDPDRSVQCNCARTQCGISAGGDVYPCIAAPIPSGNLHEQSFRDIWMRSPVLQGIRGLTRDDFSVCAPCEHRAYCQRNSGSVYASTGAYTGAESMMCHQAEILHRIHDDMGLMV